jgi:hypothetical protein
MSEAIITTINAFSTSAPKARWISLQPVAANDTDYPDSFVSFKGRSAPKPDELVAIYRNLNKPNFFSIQMREGPSKGLVVGYAPAVCINNVTLIVRHSGRDRAIEKKQRNVHAWAEGFWEDCAEAAPLSYQRKDARRHTYFPFIKPHFFERTAPNVPVTSIKRAWITGADILALSEEVR